ncbi:DUF5704 domain-containing protein, partial [Saccharibacillus alkalitolerans]
MFYKGTEAVKTINVDAQTYTGTETFTGEALPVISKDNDSAGSWMAWSRGILSTEWTAGNEFSTWREVSDITPASNATENITTIDSGVTYNKNYKKAPYKEVRLKVKYSRTKGFTTKIGTTDLVIPTEFIDDRANTLRLQNPSTPGPETVSVDNRASVPTGNLNIEGKNHYSTHIESILVGVEPNGDVNAPTRSLDYATIQFTQKHDLNTAKYYLRQGDEAMRLYEDSNPKAQAMAFYYAAYTFNVKSFTYKYPDKYWVYTEDSEDGPPSQGFCAVQPGRTIEGEDMQPAVSAVIKADQRDREIFDVLQGIPTSESLYGNVLAKDYLHQFKFQEQKVTCIYEVPVTQPYLLKWDPGKTVPNNPPPGTHEEPDPQSEETSVVYNIHTERYFTYWTVEKLGVYAIDSAELKNYAFQGESITIYPEGYVPPELTVEKNGGYTAPPVPNPFTAPNTITVPGGQTKPQPTFDADIAQGLVEAKIGKIKGRNDKVVFKGQTLMDDREVEVQTPEPRPVPNGTQIGRNVLYSPNNMIPKTKTNRYAAPSMGTVSYNGLDANYEAPDGDTYPIPNINPVTVHTPVVNYSSASDDAAHNQKTNPNY